MTYAIPTLLALGVLVTWWREHRHNRRPEMVALCWTLTFLAAAFFVQLASPVIRSTVPMPALADYVMHAFGLVSAFWMSAFALHLGQAESVAPRTVRRRAWLLAAALIALTVFYVIGPVHAGLTTITAESEAPFVAHYFAVFAAYLGLALIEVAWMTGYGEPSTCAWVRRGIRLLRAGACVGLLDVALLAATAILAAAGARLPWADAGAFGLGTYLMLPAVVLMTAGILTPALGRRWQARDAAPQHEST